MKNNNDKSMEEILRDTKHNKKANTLFLKLLSLQKSKHKDWSDARAEIYNPAYEIKSGPEYD